MAELIPHPFDALVRRMFREFEARGSIFDLPAHRFVLGQTHRDLSTRCHGARAATPLGPAAGPQSQMAQNIVLSWLGGSRIIELKTVQVDDRLAIPRPCIDMQTVGYNVEWSQELRLRESLEEYVKGAMLVRLLEAEGALDIAHGFSDTIYDMSVGYSLDGIRSDTVDAFIRGMLDPAPIVDRLRDAIPAEWAHLRDIELAGPLSNTLTLSTFHGCPPDEIERIIVHLLETHHLHCVVKLNPMLLGPDVTRHLLHDVLGYDDLRVPDSAFERDTRWHQAEGFVERLSERARALGLGFGVKFSNTLIVENHREFFPSSEREMYLSGPPLHVLAIELVRRFRARFGTSIPVSFSAGIARANFPDAVALGLVPITVCTDLLKPGGYARSHGYFAELEKRMDAVGAKTLPDFILRAYGHAAAALGTAAPALEHVKRERLETAATTGEDLRATAADDQLYDAWIEAATLLNTATYAEHVVENPRYTAEHNRKIPRKIGSHLALFDCITCDKCVPVCPNDANFTLHIPATEIPVVSMERTGDTWRRIQTDTLRIEEKHQIANFADFCNDCGNCDVFCPEDGGPYIIKPRFFGQLTSFEASADRDGFHVELGDTDRIHARLNGVAFEVEVSSNRARFRGNGFDVTFDPHDPERTITGNADIAVDLTLFFIANVIRRALRAKEEVNYVNTMR